MSYYESVFYDEPHVSLQHSTISHKQEKVISAAVNWLSSQILSKWKEPDVEALAHFNKEITSAIYDSFERIQCANLRTTDKCHSKLYDIAEKCHIPQDVIPQDVSLIVNKKGASYYQKQTGNFRFVII